MSNDSHGKSDGLLYLILSDYDDYDDDEANYQKEEARKRELERKYKKKKNEAVKLVAGLTNKEQIQNKIVKKIIQDELDKMIDKYAEEEYLPIEFVNIAKQSSCLEILIKGFLKKIGDFELTLNIIDEINSFINTIYINDDLQIVYERVSRIQKFIHKKIDEKHGLKAHLNLPKWKTKHLLSCCRLHLNLYDLKYKDINSLAYLIETSNQASDAEMNNPAKVVLPKGKKYVKDWKVMHLKTLLSYNEIDKKINQIFQINKNMSDKKFKNQILHIYSEIEEENN